MGFGLAGPSETNLAVASEKSRSQPGKSEGLNKNFR
jgi:hypothetical protein